MHAERRDPEPSPRTLLIAGCGYVGLALSRSLITRGWTVWGLRRSPEASGLIQHAGARPILADLTQPSTLTRLPLVDCVVCCQAPGGDPTAYRSTYLDGTRNLIQALQVAPPRKLLWISSTRVYGQSREEWVDEETEPMPTSEEARILLEAEGLALQAPFPSLVLRLAGLYGPGRDHLALLRRGRAPIDAAGFLNQIHIDDVVGLIELLLERGEPKQIYLGVDDEPVRRADFYRWLAERAGIPIPLAPADATARASGKRCSNRKVKALGYRFVHPDYRAGYAQLLASR